MLTRVMSPVARFSLALAAVLAVTALVLGAGTAYLIGRYVDDETTAFTQDAVASHFGSVFSDDVFQRGLTSDEREELLEVVTFHFSIYNVVATDFFDRTGTIVFSYDSDEIGRQLDSATYPELASALNGMREADRTTIVADPKLGVPGSAVGYGSFNTHHMLADAPAAATPGAGTREIRALEAWVPVKQNGQVVGAVVVWRDIAPLDAALMRIQITIAAIIALAAAFLWLVLRGVYARSSKRATRTVSSRTWSSCWSRWTSTTPSWQRCAAARCFTTSARSACRTTSSASRPRSAKGSGQS